MNAVSVTPTSDHLLPLPDGVGRALVRASAMFACGLLTRAEFCAFCKKRNLSIDVERLGRWERLDLIRPVFRVRPGEHGGVQVPLRDGPDPFDTGIAIDSTGGPGEGPLAAGETDEAFYSVFQIDEVRLLVSEFTLHVHLDSYLESPDAIDSLQGQAAKWMEFAHHARSRERSRYRMAVALLCQAISNRYYPNTQTDQRVLRVIGGGGSWNHGLSVNRQGWHWAEYARQWKPQDIARLFALTPERLRYAYETLASGQAFLDPIASWYPLVQFVDVDMREALKGDALLAQTLREGALMLRSLYHDLYGEELCPVNEVHVTVIRHVPELDIRVDTRRYLEFVANRFGVNPQPKLVLMVEGETELHAVQRIFDDVFGLHPGRCGIEIINLGGVSNATGGKQDRYQAIFRLIDYLHHHQTLTYLILDNEGQALHLQRVAKDKASIHGHRRRVTRPEYIHVWKQSFEFDNFTDAELAAALTSVAHGAGTFDAAEVAACRADADPGARLGALFKTRVGHTLPKVDFFDAVLTPLLAVGRRSSLNARAIVRQVRKIIGLTSKNPLPVMQTIWAKNQQSKLLSRKR